MKITIIFRFLILACLLSSCIGNSASTNQEVVPRPTPTISPLFVGPNEKTPLSIDAIPTENIPLVQTSNLPTQATSTSEPVFQITPNTVLITSTVPITPTFTPQPTPSQPTTIITDTVYNGVMNPNWNLQPSLDMSYELQNISHTYQGSRSLAITPKTPGNEMLFLVRPNATVQYLHDQVFGLSFWLNSGNNTIDPGDLSVTVIASNQHPYYDPNDHSADSQSLLTESGARLYDLGLNRPLPPNTWFQVLIKLDTLVFDPGVQPTPVVDTDYKYVTGFVLKDEGKLLQSFYVTQVGILLLH